jgi:hypothetical protein
VRRTYRIPLYEMKLVVIVTPAPYGDYHIPANAAARAHNAPVPFPGQDEVKVGACVWVDYDKGRHYVLLSSKANVNDIAHEAAHIAQDVLDRTSLPPRRRGAANEQYTYLVGWVAQRLYDTVKGKWSSSDAAAQRAAARL